MILVTQMLIVDYLTLLLFQSIGSWFYASTKEKDWIKTHDGTVFLSFGALCFIIYSIAITVSRLSQ